MSGRSNGDTFVSITAAVATTTGIPFSPGTDRCSLQVKGITTATVLIAALKSDAKDVYYVAPTFQQAKDIMWGMLKEIGKSVIKVAHENTAVLTLVNDRKIYLKGSDRPETLLGVGLCFVVLDEFASMKPQVWEQILQPTLAD